MADETSDKCPMCGARVLTTADGVNGYVCGRTDGDVVQTSLCKIRELIRQLARVRAVLEGIVCTEGVDKGVVMLSDHGPTHPVIVGEKTIQVYDHEYFSPLGDALIAAWKLTLTRATERR